MLIPDSATPAQTADFSRRLGMLLSGQDQLPPVDPGLMSNGQNPQPSPLSPVSQPLQATRPAQQGPTTKLFGYDAIRQRVPMMGFKETMDRLRPGPGDVPMPAAPAPAPEALGSALAQHGAQPGTQNGLDANGVLWQNGKPIGVTPGRNNSAIWNQIDPSVNAPGADLAQSGGLQNREMYDQIARAYGVPT